jgi:4-hydroxythreonine-4-phosphate dehydrogenase
MGDACGVGPEIVLRTFAEGRWAEDCLVVGDRLILEECNQRLDLHVPMKLIEEPQPVPGILGVLDLGLLLPEDVTPGMAGKIAGDAALQYVDRATRLALAGKLSAVVTQPMNKHATRLTHPDFTGHTEYIAALCNTHRYTMMLASEELIVTHVSTHCSLKQAIGSLNTDRILDVIRLTASAVAKLDRTPKVAVLGLNPHAGEEGAFGNEDAEIIAPAVAQARKSGLDVEGPLPPDTVFGKALKRQYGAVVCMYHDQGHIPMKMIGFEKAVNVTLGLPIVRTSVDHGTAYDIAWQGVASIESFIHAVELARTLGT